MDGNEGYQPIACDFHDDLEAYAVARRRVRVFHMLPDAPPARDKAQGLDRAQGDEGAPPLRNEGHIRDIYTTGQKEEFLSLDDGTLIRLDRILWVEGLI